VSGRDDPSLSAGLKEFGARENTIGPAVALPIGAAFSNVAKSVAGRFINPLVDVFDTRDLAGCSSCPKGAGKANGKGDVLSGSPTMCSLVLGAELPFLIVSAGTWCPMIVPPITDAVVNSGGGVSDSSASRTRPVGTVRVSGGRNCFTGGAAASR
jgi:large conductance mechanosensitive channel